MTERLLIVGGDAAGMSAAAQARRRRSPDELEIVAFERGDYTSYSACGLPYYVADDVDVIEQLIARSPSEHEARDVTVFTRHEVVAIDLAARTVTVRDLAAEHDRTEPFDQLVIATGAVPIRPDLPGADARGVHGIQTVGDGNRLKQHLSEHTDGKPRAVVVGGGYIGLELAEALHHRGVLVTVVERSLQPMTTLDPDMGKLVADAMQRIGIELHSNTTVEGFETDASGHLTGVVTAGHTFPADIVVLGIGVRPNVSLAKDAGIEIGETGGIATDARMQTNVEGVWAAGDCVQVHHRITGKPAFVALGTHANKAGRVIGVNATGGDATFAGVVGTAVTKICAYEIGRTGLSEREATEAELDFVTATIESTTRAGYFPGASPITVKIVAERGSGRLLGAQIIGQEGAAKRIDIAATALWAGLKVQDVAELDLGYAPPFSPVWDPVIVAARKASALV